MTNYVEQNSGLRDAPPFAWLSNWEKADNRDPLAIIDRIAEGRNPDLVARRNDEMASSSFNFFRGAAAVMADDLETSLNQSTGIKLVICGDAHLGNFGAYLSPERTPVFDLNDFDEARPGPWEWDVCRLAASITVAGAEIKSGDDDAEDSVTPAVEAYADALQRIVDGQLVERYYDLKRVADGVSKTDKPKFSNVRPKLPRLFTHLHVHTQEETVQDYIDNESDGSAFSAQGEVRPIPPEDSHQVTAAYRTYLDTVATGLERLLAGYSPTCVAQRPVGEGSLGLHDYLLLITGQGAKDRLILQLKEATPSALDSALGARSAIHEGERVVQMQKTMQGVSDPLLGWTSIDGQAYYVRQFRDGKASPDLAKLTRHDLTEYATLCGESLARAHARSAEPRGRTLATMSEDIESDRTGFISAVAEFAKCYAAVTQDDRELLKARNDAKG